MYPAYIVCVILLIIAFIIYLTTRRKNNASNVSASGGSVAVGRDSNAPITLSGNHTTISANSSQKKAPFDWPKAIASILAILAGVIGVLTKLGYV